MDTTVRLSDVIDWYVLQALQFRVWATEGLRDDGENLTKLGKLEKRLGASVEYYTGQLARTFESYIWYSCVGEARHAFDEAQGSAPENLSGDISRGSACNIAGDFDPKYWRDLLPVFEANDWSSGYGGMAWGRILASLKYTEYPGVFVDLVVDLEHNSGCVFNKPQAADYAGLIIDIRTGLFKSFLSAKSYSDLLDPAVFSAWGKYCRDYTLDLVREVLGYMPVSEDDDVHGKTGLPVAQVIDWGEDRFEDVEWIDTDGGYHCENCGTHVTEDSAYSDDNGLYCYGCWIEDHVKCENCGEWVYEYKAVITHTGHAYCMDCDECYAVCEDCSEIHDAEDITEGLDGLQYCPDCIADHQHVCEFNCELGDDASYWEDETDPKPAKIAAWYNGKERYFCCEECKAKFVEQNGYYPEQYDFGTISVQWAEIAYAVEA